MSPSPQRDGPPPAPGEPAQGPALASPFLTIDCDTIERNARAIVALCGRHGIAVAGVTKVVCGHPEVARAMLRGGVTALAESRLENVWRLRRAGIAAPMLLLSLPPLSAVEAVVEAVETSLNTELAVLGALSRAALRRGTVHGAILMVELGELREGLLPEDVIPFVEQARRLEGIRLEGLGTNLACFAGLVPTRAQMERLAALAGEVEARFGLALRWVSGANSSGLGLIAAGAMPGRINHARIGEAIVLGRETVHRKPWPGTAQDAFALHAEVVELKRKPSLPLGERGEDAFGRTPAFAQRGEVLHALLNVGREDTLVEGLTPHDPRLAILGATSGYLVLDASAAAGTIGVGDTVSFALSYGALLGAMTSAYVQKRLLHQGPTEGQAVTPGMALGEAP